jgi:hypothetical protein
MAVFFFSLIQFEKNCLTKELMLKIHGAASTGSHGRYMKYVSFPWPPVLVAHNRKKLVQAPHSSGGYWL